MTAERTTITLTYAGRRENREGKLVHEYWHEGQRQHYRKALYPATVGAQITLESDEEHVYPGTAKYAGRTEGEQVATWAAMDKAVVGAAEARKMAKAVDPFKEALAPLKDAYMNGTPIQRAALVTAVVKEITSWGS